VIAISYIEIMNLILEYRRSKKITQKVLASKIGISQSVLCDYELGKKIPSVKTAKKIEQITKICAKKIVFGDT